MQKFLTSKSIFFSKSSWILLILFLVLRPISFLLAGHLIIQGILVFLLLMTLGILYFKNPNWAWYLVLGELFLGGAGHYIELMGLSIRTLLIVFFLFLWASHHLGQRILIQKFKIHKYANYLIIFLFIFIALAFFNGLANSHGFRQVVADVIPFSFLLLIFPSFHLFKDEKVQKYLIRLLVVFVIGTAIFSLTAFTLFSTGATEIHNDFYKWYRDVDMGKRV